MIAVAQHAGVSLGTVSNVLNRPDLVAEATRERVNAAIAELGFVRNDTARQLRVGRSRTLGLVVLDVANPFFTDVARGVEDMANQHGLAVILCNSDKDEDKEAAHLDLLAEMRVRGVLINPIGTSDGRIKALRDRGTPVVLFDRRGDSSVECSVAVDDVLGGRLAAQHVIDAGHRRIAFVGGPSTQRQVQERYNGAMEAIAASGTNAQLTVIAAPAPDVVGGRQAGDRMIAGAELPTAVLCANDLVALGVLQALSRASIRVPQDVAIVGYDDIDFAAAAGVPLTSVRQPRQLLGRTAAELLLAETAPGKHEHQQVVFEPELVVRDSSAT
ncbi:LacI family DNA-binding transcriptional regulator [Jiangella asiatica]|uniref:LacI family transcriptional regulator n=1 Tax=Jiangella asiatica TaxID=2530372 RepID=A0A4R5CWY6_9ACTN|nr:LacI family DNA-binding transcriptional regulator [Jiangella asiatica]TDE03084.1 LacI family transcriptional regulator [Jiangella asiatica]